MPLIKERKKELKHSTYTEGKETSEKTNQKKEITGKLKCMKQEQNMRGERVTKTKSGPLKKLASQFLISAGKAKSEGREEKVSQITTKV